MCVVFSKYLKNLKYLVLRFKLIELIKEVILLNVLYNKFIE